MLFLIIVISDAAQILALLIIVRAILTWIPSVDYRHPVVRALVRVTDPVLQPIRRLIPPLGGVDVTPIAALVLIEIARNVLIWIVGRALGGA